MAAHSQRKASDHRQIGRLPHSRDGRPLVHCILREYRWARQRLEGQAACGLYAFLQKIIGKQTAQRKAFDGPESKGLGS